MSTTETPTVQSSKAEVWYLKDVIFGTGEIKRQHKIITQNFNGPCSLIAICNILILRGDITIMPPDRKTVSYEFLSQLIADYLLTNAQDQDIDVSAAFSMLPHTQKGMDLNPVFTSPFKFNPAGDEKALDLFKQTNMQLVHGWLVDPDAPEAEAVMAAQDYDNATILIAEADHLTNGQLVHSRIAGSSQQAGPSSSLSSPPDVNGHVKWTEEQRSKVERGLAVRHFLDASWSQLTYHGLFTLSNVLEPGSLVALFRSSHLSVLHKSTAEGDPNGPALYNLVTDHALLNEPSIVWERIEDVDMGGSMFVDADFRRATPAGGDFAGQSPEAVIRASLAAGDPNDLALAQQLQQEEDDFARRQRQAYTQNKLKKEAEMAAQEREKLKREGKSKKSDCVIM